MPEKGVAHISGALCKHEDRGRVPEAVARIPGVEKVQLNVTWCLPDTTGALQVCLMPTER